MGNLCGRQSSMAIWAGDDWGSLTKVHDEDCIGTERQRLISEEKKVGGSIFATTTTTSSGSIGEVKIKITKRELEELMGRAKMEGLTMEQVLYRLLENNNYEEKYEMNQHHFVGSWRPALQSIPE